MLATHSYGSSRAGTHLQCGWPLVSLSEEAWQASKPAVLTALHQKRSSVIGLNWREGHRCLEVLALDLSLLILRNCWSHMLGSAALSFASAGSKAVIVHQNFSWNSQLVCRLS